MPSIKASAKVDLKGWEPASAPPQQGNNSPSSPTPTDPTARSPFMLSSMPLMASTGDAFARQFYGQGNTPSQRILPAKRGAGA
jgi:hypothetical protein